MSAIKLRGVSVQLGEVQALREISFELEARTIAVVGENGSGKSTLARLIAGLIRASSGEVRILGLDPVRQIAELRRRVAVVFSNPDAQIVMPTVAEDVAFSLRSERIPATTRAARVADALDRFGLTELTSRPSHDLSGGQKQLLALAGAFVRQPELIVADEPTAYLDARNARAVANHLLADTGHQLVLVTHDLALAQRCDVAVLITDGAIEIIGEPAMVAAKYEASIQE